MYFASKSHGEKIFHHSHCTYVKRTKMENRIQFYTEKEAREKGYRMCNCCSHMGKQFRKEKEEIQELARKNRVKVWLYDGAVYLETDVAPWKIISAGQQHKLFLYHGNHERYENLKKRNGMLEHHYHSQSDARGKTIVDYMNYIIRHDQWREQIKNEYRTLPKTTKRQRDYYKSQKKKARRNAIHNVYNLIEKIRVENNYAMTM